MLATFWRQNVYFWRTWTQNTEKLLEDKIFSNIQTARSCVRTQVTESLKSNMSEQPQVMSRYNWQ
jgi:hypothetical protein